MAIKLNDNLVKTLVDLVERELAKANQHDPGAMVLLQAERLEIAKNKEGWQKSIGRPDLAVGLRRNIEDQWKLAEQREADIEQQLQQMESMHIGTKFVVDAAVIREKVSTLHETLSNTNATVMNFELAQHIDRIDCWNDGRVIVRICKLGILPNPSELISHLSNPAGASSAGGSSPTKAKPRKRARLAVESNTSTELTQALEFASDPHRFAGLPEDCFWEIELAVRPRQCWAEEFADEVFREWNEGQPKPTLEALAKSYGKSIPTIRKAIRIAERR